MADPQPPQATTEAPFPGVVALTFTGPIQEDRTEGLKNCLCFFAQKKVKKFILLMSSIGGDVNEGFALFNLIKSMPYEVTIVNIGSIQSIANVIFLAGDVRICCPESNFLLHNFTWTYSEKVTLTEPQLTESTQSLTESRRRFIEVFEAHTSLKKEDFDVGGYFEKPHFMNPITAQQKGVVHKVENYSLPHGVHIENIVLPKK